MSFYLNLDFGIFMIFLCSNRILHEYAKCIMTLLLYHRYYIASVYSIHTNYTMSDYLSTYKAELVDRYLQNQISNSEKDTLHALELCYVDKHPLYDIFSLQATNIAFVNVVRNVVELTTINYNIIIKVSL